MKTANITRPIQPNGPSRLYDVWSHSMQMLSIPRSVPRGRNRDNPSPLTCRGWDINVYSPFVTFVREFSSQRNIFEAICTTAKVRIYFYRQGILLLQNFRVLNIGTGSLIYTLSPREASLPRGKYLGQFKDELEMRSWIIGLGPKSYGYVAWSGKHCRKTRGFPKISTTMLSSILIQKISAPW